MSLGNWLLSERQIVRDDFANASEREFMVHEGELYLAVQATRPSLVLVTFADMPRWDSVKIRSFRDRHPEVESMWPIPSRDDGGVPWVRGAKE